MSDVLVKLAYDGDAVSHGQMDVYELAPALLAFGDTFKDANALLNGNLSSVTVKVNHTIRRGSFEISLVIDSTLLEHAKALLFTSDIKSAKDLAILLGFSSGMGDVHAQIGLMHLLKLLRGHNPTVEEKDEKSGQVVLKINNSTLNNTTFVVNKDVFTLYESKPIRQSIERIVQPLETSGVDKLVIQDGSNIVQTIQDEELPYYKSQALNPAELIIADEQLRVEERVMEFEVVSPVFRDGNKWRLSDGRVPSYVEIQDQEFITRVKRREELFGTGDILKVKVTQVSRYTNAGLKTDYVIQNVLEHIIPTNLPL